MVQLQTNTDRTFHIHKVDDSHITASSVTSKFQASKEEDDPPVRAATGVWAMPCLCSFHDDGSDDQNAINA